MTSSSVEMSFIKPKELIYEGDTVILYININSMYAIEVKPFVKNKKDDLVPNVFQTAYGALKVMSLVGKKYGSKVELSRGWAYVLHPTPELWTLTLPHRTQIIYSLDASIIVFQLEIKPGSVVVEAGTGSGSLSHALIRNLQPTGHLYTFDFHNTRVDQAKVEFEKHGLSKYVTIAPRDVCQDGFGEELVGKADAVFLDLPHPWEAIQHVVQTLKSSGGRFCSFSPCIEQVQKTCQLLHKSGFTEVTTLECLQKEYQVQHRTVPVLDLTTDYAREDVGEEQDPSKSNKQESVKYITGVAPVTMPGHTGYLTFATLPPVWARTGLTTEDQM